MRGILFGFFIIEIKEQKKYVNFCPYFSDNQEVYKRYFYS